MSWGGLLSKVPNQFAQPKEEPISDDAKTKAGCISLLYLFLLAALTVVLTAYYGLQKQVTLVSVPEPLPEGVTPSITYSQYSTILSRQPICQCSSITMQVKTFATYTPTYFWLCQTLLKYATVNNTIPTRLDPSRVGVFTSILRLCQSAVRLNNATMISLGVSSFVSPAVLDPDTFKSSVNALYQNQLSVNEATFNHPLSVVTLWSQVHMGTKNGIFSGNVGLEDTLIDLSGLNATILPDPLNQNTNADPYLKYPTSPVPQNPVQLRLRTYNKAQMDAAGCDCRADWSCVSPASAARGWFASACDGLSEVLGHRLKTSLLASFNPTSCATCCTAFRTNPATAVAVCQGLNPSVPFSDLEEACYYADLTAAASSTTLDSLSSGTPSALIATSSIIADHEAYFKKCAPAKCVYNEQRTRSGADVLTAVLGIVGGGQTVLLAFFSRVAKYIIRQPAASSL